MQQKKRIGICLVVLSLLAGGCGARDVSMAQESNFDSAYVNTTQESTIGTYDSADTAIVKAVDDFKKEVTFVNYESGKSYTLTYDGTTTVQDKYAGAMIMSQVQPGDVVDILFLKDAKKLTGLQMNADAWSYDQIEKYSLAGSNESASIGDETYRLKDSALILADGEEIDKSEVVKNDVVSIKGIGRNIFSVVVEKGHGYLRLNNDAYVLGGWIEVGQAVIQQITEGMLLTVPEGSYNVRLTCKGIDTTRTIEIERNKESVIDLGDIEIEEIVLGKLFITVEPESASIYIDGEEVDISKPVELEYGLHQIMSLAEGYETVRQYIKVGEEAASINITMDEKTDSSETTNTVSGNELTTGNYKVYVDSPEGVEVYVDGVYVGLSPVSFNKVAGSHTITLRKVGCITRSYTIQVDETAQDVTYSFTNLDAGESDITESMTVSGNTTKTVSGNSSTVSGN